MQSELDIHPQLMTRKKKKTDVKNDPAQQTWRGNHTRINPCTQTNDVFQVGRFKRSTQINHQQNLILSFLFLALGFDHGMFAHAGIFW